MLVLKAVAALHHFEPAAGHARGNALLCVLPQRLEASVLSRSEARVLVIRRGHDDQPDMRQAGRLDLVRGRRYMSA